MNCPNCNYKNRIGELFCVDCGESLFDDPFKKEITSTRQLSVTAPVARNTPVVGTTHLSLNEEFVLIPKSKPNEENLVMKPKEQMIIGRADVKSNHYPDIDLGPFGALEEGISRIHARINKEGRVLSITDLDSVNGTYVNGQKVEPNQTRILRDGDELTFGRLVMQIFFR